MKSRFMTRLGSGVLGEVINTYRCMPSFSLLYVD